MHGASQCKRKKDLDLLGTFAHATSLVHTPGVTLPDFGTERPGAASETRQMGERSRTEAGGDISNPSFAIALAVIVIGIVIVVLMLR